VFIFVIFFNTVENSPNQLSGYCYHLTFECKTNKISLLRKCQYQKKVEEKHLVCKYVNLQIKFNAARYKCVEDEDTENKVNSF